MKKYLPTFTVLLLLLILPSSAWSTKYYVAQTSAGTGDGSTYANRMSVATHNSSTFNPGDVLYFSGTIASQITVPSSGNSIGGYITYDGYAAGNYDARSEGTGTIAKISRSQSKGILGIKVNDKNHIIIQDFEIEQCETGICSVTGDYFVVKRCFMHDMLCGGITISSASNVTIGGSSSDGIVVKDTGTATADEDIMLLFTDAATVSYSKLYATKSAGLSTDRGIDGITTIGTSNLIIEYNEICNHRDEYGSDAKGEDGIGIKAGSYNVTVRYNKVYGNRQSGITVQGSATHDVDVYGNLVYENGAPLQEHHAWPGILIQRDTYNINIYSNICYRNDGFGISVQYAGGGDNHTVHDVRICNNVLAENSQWTGYKRKTISGVGITAGYNHIVKNNIFYKNQPNMTYHRQVTVGTAQAASTTLEHNRYYWPSQSSRIYWAGKDYTIARAKAYLAIENDAPAGSEEDPGFSDAANHDYTLTSGSSAIRGGAVFTMSPSQDGNDFADRLHPYLTDWAAYPLTVKSTKEKNRSFWMQGAYLYVEGVLDPPCNFKPQ